MARLFARQLAQIKNSVTYDDTIAPSEANFETNPTNIETDLNNIRSQIHNLLKDQAGNWWDDLNVPATLESGSQRGVNDLNTALHAIEKKRVLRDVYDPGNDVAVPATQNYVILALGGLPTQTTAAVGAVTTLGTVAAYDSVFTGNTLDEVAGTNALNPKNLCIVTDASTGDPILSAGRIIYALFQTENNSDGHTMTGTTPNRAKLSFVRPNATYDDLEACPFADIESTTINYATRERVRLSDLTEQDFLKGAVVDVPAGSTPTRQSVYDNQGVTPVDVTTDSILDLEGAGLEWQIRDDLEAILFRVIEGSAGGTSKVAVEADVDEFDVNAVVTDFLNGIKVDTGAAGTTIDIGVTGANAITSGGDLKMAATTNLRMTDQYEPVGWSLDGIALSDAAADWTNFETNFGEVSLMNAINQAFTNGGRTKGYAVLTTDVPANTDLALTTAGNLDVDLPDYSGVDSFVTDCDVFLNNEWCRNGPDAAANHDVYPGTTPSVGMLKFEYDLITGDTISMIVYNS